MYPSPAKTEYLTSPDLDDEFVGDKSSKSEFDFPPTTPPDGEVTAAIFRTGYQAGWKKGETVNDVVITNYIQDGHWWSNGVDKTQEIMDSGNQAKLEQHQQIIIDL